MRRAGISNTGNEMNYVPADSTSREGLYMLDILQAILGPSYF